MRTHRSNPLHASRLRPLAACLAIAFSAEVLAVPGTGDHGSAALSHARLSQAALTEKPPATPDAPTTWVVQNCGDNGTDSLRDIVENPNKAKSGDTVDLSQLPALCGVAGSTITLTTGQIVISQNGLTLQGPASAPGSVKISGSNASRVLEHTGSGTLSINGLTIADGYYVADGRTYGGCIDSANSSVYLMHSTVVGCTVMSNNSNAYGGGVSAVHGDVTTVNSTVTGNQAIAPAGRGLGGGIYAYQVTATYSSISHNIAGDGSVGGWGGGLFAGDEFVLRGSTIDNNKADQGSAIWSIAGASVIANSTISGNIAHSCCAIFLTNAPSLSILNSTIVLNTTNPNANSYAAVFFFGMIPNSSLTLQSSIVANNTTGNVDADIFIYPGHGHLDGADNLVIASNVSPQPGVITVTTDPMLGPLQFNGGWTATHALLPGSPALGVGNHNALPAWLTNDQRGPGYPRTTGPNANTDIGAFEFDTIFSGGFDSN